MTTQEILSVLIGFNSVSSESNLPLLEWIENYLKQFSIESRLYFGEQDNKANLWARIGPKEGAAIVLSGHTDVVPVEGQEWDQDPFTMVTKDQKYFGRGTCDMKGFIASALAAVPKMLDGTLQTPIEFAFSYDEETGCIGVQDLIRHYGGELQNPFLVWVGEPTLMKLVNRHKHTTSLHTIVKGVEAHSSRIDIGVNAVYYAARLVNKIEDLAEERKNHRGDCDFTPNYTTIHVGVLQGGVQQNIVPNHAEITWEMRIMPEENEQEILLDYFAYEKKLLEEIKKKNPKCDIHTNIDLRTPGLIAKEQSKAEEFMRRITGDNATFAAPYATEAGHFQAKNCDVIICGPGSIDQAHAQNEYVTIEQMRLCDDYIEKCIRICQQERLS